MIHLCSSQGEVIERVIRLFQSLIRDEDVSLFLFMVTVSDNLASERSWRRTGDTRGWMRHNTHIFRILSKRPANSS